MLISRDAKAVSHQLRSRAPAIRKALRAAYERAVLGCTGEVRFFDRLIEELKTTVEALRVPGVEFAVRVARIHQKPIVTFQQGSCELGDLMVVVKYHLLDGSVEKKTIIYQVKMSDAGAATCKIDPRQLNLLRAWPPFRFGRPAAGGPVWHNVRPTTLEFGSYMLEPRGVAPDPARRRAYGSAPTAHTVGSLRKPRVPIHNLPYTRGDYQNFFSHLIFEIGEHDGRPEVDRLVEAVYRYVGLDPDPPGEFDGFAGDRTANALFAVLEVNVVEGEGLLVEGLHRTVQRPADAVLGRLACAGAREKRWKSVREMARQQQTAAQAEARAGEAATRSGRRKPPPPRARYR